MNDVDKKVSKLLEKINFEMQKLGATTVVTIGQMTTEDTGELYWTIEIKMGAGAYLAYSSPNYVGIKTFLQGFLISLQLVSGEYRLKPLSELARRMIPQSIIPRLSGKNVIGAREQGQKTRICAKTHPRFSFHRNKFTN